jgi:hypothetical protein
MSITVTEKAARHIQKTLDKRGKGVGLRLAVKTSGCSGMAYALEFADESQPEDLIFESPASSCWWTRAAFPTSTAPSSTSCAKASTKASSSTTRTPRPKLRLRREFRRLTT